MVEGRTRVLAMEYPELMNRHLCPERGSAMAAVDHVRENGFLFVWYECTRPDCDGQWLRKTAVLARPERNEDAAQQQLLRRTA